MGSYQKGIETVRGDRTNYGNGDCMVKITLRLSYKQVLAIKDEAFPNETIQDTIKRLVLEKIS